MAKKTLEEGELTRADLLARLNAQIPGEFKLDIVKCSDIDYLAKNARYMTNEVFSNLVGNLKRDRALSSIPLCIRRSDGSYEVISGNHRIKAAVAAGIEETLILWMDGSNMTDSEKFARALSHNEIVGQDDPTIKLSMYEDITDVGWKEYSGLDDKTLGLLEALTAGSMSEIGLEFQPITFLFLPDEVEQVKAALDLALLTLNSEFVVTARMAEYDRFMDALAREKDISKVGNGATAVMLMLDRLELLHAEAEEESDGEA